jgi:hypothetical protein
MSRWHCRALAGEAPHPVKTGPLTHYKLLMCKLMQLFNLLVWVMALSTQQRLRRVDFIYTGVMEPDFPVACMRPDSSPKILNKGEILSWKCFTYQLNQSSTARNGNFRLEKMAPPDSLEATK